jgi:hypothetical protein
VLSTESLIWLVSCSSDTDTHRKTSRHIPEDTRVSQLEQGRLVWNHSTHLPGLIPLLEKLIAQESCIQTVTPGRLSTARSNAPHLRLKVSVPIRGGFKLIARKGRSAQEVFIVTGLDQMELESAINRILSSTSG